MAAYREGSLTAPGVSWYTVPLVVIIGMRHHVVWQTDTNVLEESAASTSTMQRQTTGSNIVFVPVCQSTYQHLLQNHSLRKLSESTILSQAMNKNTWVY